MPSVFIVDAVRTPRAKRKGRFSGLHPVDLLTYPLNAIAQRHKLDPANVDDVVVGCVTQTGEQGWCVGRAAVLAAGWPVSVPATTVNRLCGSGQQALNFVHSTLASGAGQVGIAAGLEHMTRVPMFSDMGGEASTFLTEHHPDLVQQGESAEILSETYGIGREALDQYAYESQMRAARAQKEGRFDRSVIAVPYRGEDGTASTMTDDDTVRPGTTLEALASLKPAFRPNGVITAGNASAIVDGAAAALLVEESALAKHGLKPRARVVATAAIGSPPRIMLTGPIGASRLVLERAKLSVDDIDVWEINEAFAPVPLVTMQELKIDPARVNINGGGISLGHPLGATGVMLLGMALDELERGRGKYALITMCIGLGMGIATIVERI